MNLDAYSIGALQNFSGLLQHAKNNNVFELGTLKNLVDTYIYENFEKPLKEAQRVTRTVKKVEVCPVCGEKMFYVPNSEELFIVGCKKCRYSAILEANGGINGK